eukprot:CAMPEP_0202103234 /NCGR_PEP_ID=MMETSP0965-20130614/4774_1 /ASSEMBLY_ACC=CAM_ASM_000507 /TAXON_ID=4773 /ORGANISM="Schizochytrium aggregatum, Strain ATCC28209" /LENGTH=50 /DNA_ID=CAMNT_0048672027 /DNA_START=526 /DNA_END=678 /DNA_ORIENTATION=-
MSAKRSMSTATRMVVPTTPSNDDTKCIAGGRGQTFTFEPYSAGRGRAASY